LALGQVHVTRAGAGDARPLVAGEARKPHTHHADPPTTAWSVPYEEPEPTPDCWLHVGSRERARSSGSEGRHQGRRPTRVPAAGAGPPWVKHAGGQTRPGERRGASGRERETAGGTADLDFLLSWWKVGTTVIRNTDACTLPMLQ
jgi:hypothetical protein